MSTTYASHVEDKKPTAASHDGGISLVTASHTRKKSPNYASHVGDQHLVTASQVGGINTIEILRCIGCNPNLPCNIFEGDQLNHLCPIISMV
jgi:hypothetical protein